MLYILYILGANGQIYGGRSLRSPTAADGRKALCRSLSASLASTPLSSQYLKQTDTLNGHLCDLMSLLI